MIYPPLFTVNPLGTTRILPHRQYISFTTQLLSPSFHSFSFYISIFTFISSPSSPPMHCHHHNSFSPHPILHVPRHHQFISIVTKITSPHSISILHRYCHHPCAICLDDSRGGAEKIVKTPPMTSFELVEGRAETRWPLLELTSNTESRRSKFIQVQ